MSKNRCPDCGHPKNSSSMRCRQCHYAFMRGSGHMWTEDDIALLAMTYETSPYPARGRPRVFPKALLARHPRRHCIKYACALGLSRAVQNRILVKPVSDLDLSYIAGLWDGDGSVSLTPSPLFRVANSDFAVLDWIRQTIGSGYVHKKSRHSTHTMTHYDYILGRDADLQAFLPQILRYSRIARKAARLQEALDWLQEHRR